MATFNMSLYQRPGLRISARQVGMALAKGPQESCIAFPNMTDQDDSGDFIEPMSTPKRKRTSVSSVDQITTHNKRTKTTTSDTPLASPGILLQDSGRESNAIVQATDADGANTTKATIESTLPPEKTATSADSGEKDNEASLVTTASIAKLDTLSQGDACADQTDSELSEVDEADMARLSLDVDLSLTDPIESMRLEFDQNVYRSVIAEVEFELTRASTNGQAPEKPMPTVLQRSGRARKAPIRFGGITNSLPTNEDLDQAQEVVPDTPKKTSTGSHQTKSLPAAKPNSKAQKPSRPSTGRTAITPKISGSLITLKAAAKSIVKISTVDRPALSNLVTRNFTEQSTPKTTRGTKISPLTPASPQVVDNGPESIPEVDAELLSLSRALTYREPLPLKPEPQGKPLVWADSRQGLCETVSYFKKPQGGCHYNDGHVYAFLFDGVGHCREYMDSNVIIARAGGSMESDSSGGMLQSKDQSMNEPQVVAVLNDIKLQNPLIVICGDRNTGAPSKMPHKYCVLGWFKPVMVWAEKTKGKGKKSWVTIKYRLEKLDSTQPVWYGPKVCKALEVEKAGTLASQTCAHCAKHWPQVYLVSWICLTPSCEAFWKLVTGAYAPSGALDYNPAFLLARTLWDDEAEPFSVRPALPDVGNAIGDNLSYVNTRGVCCPECGRCNHRYKFSGWVCDNPECHWDGLPANHQPILPVSLHQPWDNIGDGPSLARNRHEASVGVTVSYTHGYKVYRYTFNGIQGSLVHAVANNKINREHQGPDEMLAAVQIEDMGLERRRFNNEKMSSIKVEKAPTPLKPSNVQGELLTPPSEMSPKLSHVQSPQLIPPGDTLPKPADVQGQLLTSSIEASQKRSDVQGKLLTPPKETSPMVDPAEVEQDKASQTTSVKQEIEAGDFMTAFSMNYGMPYKFVASGASKSFQDAPWPIRACRSRLNWAQKTLLPDRTGDVDFNEELVFAYMEGQKIEYHDDGEEGLGPRIATLSLGGKAKMHLRLKMKHFVGCSKTGILTVDDRPPVPGGLGGEAMDAKRRAAWDELQLIKDSDRALYLKRLKQIPIELGIFKDRTKKAGDLVTVTLGHGDIILMEGYDIQKYLEHKVVPEGYLRFALTCRTVLENHLKPEERPQYPVTPDDFGYDGSNLLL